MLQCYDLCDTLHPALLAPSIVHSLPTPPSYATLLDDLRHQRTLLAELEYTVARLERELDQMNGALRQARMHGDEHDDDRRHLAADLAFLFEHAIDMLIVHGIDGQVLRVAPSVQVLLGYTPDEFMELGMEGVVHPEDYPALTEHIARIINGSDGVDYVTRCRHKNGDWRWFSWTTPGARVTQCSRMFALGRDVTAREMEKQQLRHRAGHDTLTGLPNRDTFNLVLAQALVRAERSGRPLALMMIDLDGFKSVNDTHGHLAGDAVLKEVARRLAAALRKGDLVARLGGDEFVCLMEDMTHDSAATAARMIDAVSEPIAIGAAQVTIGCSIGIASFAGGACAPAALIEQADRAMYQVKTGGKRGCRHFTD